MPTEQQSWWRTFFESPDSLPLSYFPEPETTMAEVEGIEDLLQWGAHPKIADVCCGYGRHLVPLRMRGHDVIGVDISQMMLDIADFRARQAGVDITLVQGLAQRLPFTDDAFDVILNLFNSLGYMDDPENQAVLTEASRCLKSGGRFMLETRNKKFQIIYAPYNTTVSLASGEPATVRCYYDADTDRLNSVWTNPEDENDVYHRASIRLYAPGELEEMLRLAGFEVNARLSSYSGNTFEGFERQLIYLCTKR
ncbi:MAG: class I SAM-dependent methyltransferase [Armatimonadota bacterium]